MFVHAPKHTQQYTLHTRECFRLYVLTPARTLSISGLKSRVLKLSFLSFKKWSRIYFEIHRAPSEIPAKLPSQFGNSGQIFLHWAAATLKGLGKFQKNKIEGTPILKLAMVKR